MDNYRLYSVGHSNQSQEEFLGLLRAHDVNCIVDVRSVPASKYTPQFNMEPLRTLLKQNGIQYLHAADRSRPVQTSLSPSFHPLMPEKGDSLHIPEKTVE